MSQGLQASLFPITIPSKSKYAKAHAADPVYSLRWNSLHQTLETPLCRFYKVPIPWGGGTQGGPRQPKGKPKGTQGTRWDPRGPKGAQGGQGDPRGSQGVKESPIDVPKGAQRVSQNAARGPKEAIAFCNNKQSCNDIR